MDPELTASDRRDFLKSAAAVAATGGLLAGADAAEAKTARIKRRPTGRHASGSALAHRLALDTLQPVATRCVAGWNRMRGDNGSDVMSIYSATYKTYHRVTADAAGFYLVYVNAAKRTVGGKPVILGGEDDVVLKASVEGPNGEFETVKWGNATSITLYPGQVAYSDVVPITITAGTNPAQALWVRTGIDSPTGRWPISLGMPKGEMQPRSGGGATPVPKVPVQGILMGSSGGVNSGTDVPAVTSSTSGWAPVAILATPTSSTYKSTLLVGDSILNGTGEDLGLNGLTVSDLGFGVRALDVGVTGHGYLKATLPGDTASATASLCDHEHVFRVARHCNNALVNLGKNDLTANATAQAVAADVTKIWTALTWSGVRVFQTTLTPRTAGSAGSGDTSAQQTQLATFNAWLLNGAPLNAATRAPYADDIYFGPGGSSSSVPSTAIRAGASGHPLYAPIDSAAAVSPASAWQASYTADGTHPNSTGHYLMSTVVQSALGSFA